MIPPALNTDLGGKGLDNYSTPVSDFIEAVLMQLKLAKTEIAYGFSEALTKEGTGDMKKAFERMNGAES
jgi:uncharacterized oxidoreductase